MPLEEQRTCPSCLRTFASSKGLQSHLRQTTNRDCKEVLRQMDKVLPGAHIDREWLFEGEDDTVDEASELGDEEIEAEPEIFSGDFFGNDYGPDDFPGWDEEDQDGAEVWRYGDTVGAEEEDEGEEEDEDEDGNEDEAGDE